VSVKLVQRCIRPPSEPGRSPRNKSEKEKEDCSQNQTFAQAGIEPGFKRSQNSHMLSLLLLEKSQGGDTPSETVCNGKSRTWRENIETERSIDLTVCSLDRHTDPHGCDAYSR
jgi:hypothetical protein